MIVLSTEQQIRDHDWSKESGFIAISPDGSVARYVTEAGYINISATPELLDMCKLLSEKLEAHTFDHRSTCELGDKCPYKKLRKDCEHENSYVDDNYRGCPFRKIYIVSERSMYSRKWYVKFMVWGP